MAPERLGSAIERMLQGLGLAEAAERHRAIALWPLVVGEAMARHTRAVAVRGRTLEVLAQDPSWATELAFMKAELLGRLRELQPGSAIEDIRVRQGSPAGFEAASPRAGGGPPGALGAARRDGWSRAVRRARARLGRRWPHLAAVDAELSRSFLRAAARALADEEEG
ncbi:MAG: DUF721 domain-containing protein [Clostridia bacterium]|nr:DUF721 domain-containing protein [Clostridia bacterium]